MDQRDAPAENLELRRCIRDQLTLSTLPAVWHDTDPRLIAESVTDALLRMLGAELVYFRVGDGAGEGLVEVTRAADPISADRLTTAVRAWVSSPPAARSTEIVSPFGPRAIRLVAAPIDFRREAILVAGSGQLDFPTETQQLTLTMGATQAAIGMHRWDAEVALRHLNESLEQRVAVRTAELAELNRRLVAESIERERTVARLRELQLELYYAARLSTAGHMAAAMAHELNQPLTAVTNSINAARRLLARGDAALSATIREVIGEAAAEAMRAGKIIGRLRELTTRGDTEKRRESVATIVEEASALALMDSDAVGIDLTFRLDPNARTVLADRIQIQQVVTNLIRNAVEAMAGSSRRALELTTLLLAEGAIEIAVVDCGPGLPQNIRAQLFEPFVSTKRDGMGLGLSICRSIVEAHGGRLTYEPNPGGGSVFRFTVAPAVDGNHVV